MTASFDRRQVLAHRVVAQGLLRTAATVDELAVLDLGVQEAMGHPAALALAARVRDPAVARDLEVGPGTPYALAWTLRGAPHVHRRDDLDRLARALYPLSEADATGRLNETGPSVARAGIPALQQVDTAVRELRAVVRTAVPKGEASTAVTARLPPSMRRACRPCGTSHISDSAMRLSSAFAGLELDPGTSPPVLRRRPGTRVVTHPDPDALADLVVAYLALLGPATDAEVAGFLEARRADIRAHWPSDRLTEVDVEGRPAWLPSDVVDAALAAPEPSLVRLLGPFDPWVQARDRDLVVPDRSRYTALWPVLGRPGVLLVDGEVAGTWRTKASGRRLTLTVTSFGALGAATRALVEDEASRVAVVRGYGDVAVTFA